MARWPTKHFAAAHPWREKPACADDDFRDVLLLLVLVLLLPLLLLLLLLLVLSLIIFSVSESRHREPEKVLLGRLLQRAKLTTVLQRSAERLAESFT